MRSAVIAATLGMLVGCGGDGESGSGGAPPSPDELAALCTTYCTQAVACGWQPDDPTCEAECQMLATLREEWMRAFVECAAGAACVPESPEACFLATNGDVAPRPVHETYAARCMAVADVCPGTTLP